MALISATQEEQEKVWWIVVVFAVVAVLVGLVLLSQATQGIGVIALGCFLLILARIFQAEGHASAIRRAIEAQTKREA